MLGWGCPILPDMDLVAGSAKKCWVGAAETFIDHYCRIRLVKYNNQKYVERGRSLIITYSSNWDKVEEGKPPQERRPLPICQKHNCSSCLDLRHISPSIQAACRNATGNDAWPQDA